MLNHNVSCLNHGVAIAQRLRWFHGQRSLIALALTLALLTGCTSDGHFTLLGYTTAPTFDPAIRTVYIPIFGNRTMVRGIEFEITKLVHRELEAKSPYKLATCREDADTELLGTVVSRRKQVITMNQLNEVREVEVGLGVEVSWKDLRSGKTLSVADRRFELDRDPTVPPPPVLILPVSTYIPELGGSTTSAEYQAARQLARQIVQMMEVWRE